MAADRGSQFLARGIPQYFACHRGDNFKNVIAVPFAILNQA